MLGPRRSFPWIKLTHKNYTHPCREWYLRLHGIMICGPLNLAATLWKHVKTCNSVVLAKMVSLNPPSTMASFKLTLQKWPPPLESFLLCVQRWPTLTSLPGRINLIWQAVYLVRDPKWTYFVSVESFHWSSLFSAVSTHVNCGTFVWILVQLCHHPIMSITLATGAKVTSIFPDWLLPVPLSNYNLVVCLQKMPFWFYHMIEVAHSNRPINSFIQIDQSNHWPVKFAKYWPLTNLLVHLKTMLWEPTNQIIHANQPIKIAFARANLLVHLKP